MNPYNYINEKDRQLITIDYKRFYEDLEKEKADAAKVAVQKRSEEIVDKVKQYLLEEHIHFDGKDPKGNFQFVDGSPYIQSLDFEEFINILLITDHA